MLQSVSLSVYMYHTPNSTTVHFSDVNATMELGAPSRLASVTTVHLA